MFSNYLQISRAGTSHIWRETRPQPGEFHTLLEVHNKNVAISLAPWLLLLIITRMSFDTRAVEALAAKTHCARVAELADALDSGSSE